MKLGVFTVLLSNDSLDDVLETLTSKGVEAIELGTGGYPGNAHANPDILLNDEKALEAFQETIAKYEIEISALSCHGNPVHPQKEIADRFHQDFEKTVFLAEKLGVERIVTFSGCPGDCPDSKYPNWVTCAWPPDYLEILDYQWNKVLIPYWKKAVEFAKSHGIHKIAFEMHPGFAVYNTDTLLKLREAVGPEIGANFDPSHLMWQGMDPVASIRKLGDAIFHFHAKDVKIDKYNTAVSGVLDTKHYGDELNRSWIFRTVGYGHDEMVWRDIISALRMVGYDHAISIEHEDSLMSINEGLTKAIDFLQDILVKDTTAEMWWA